MHARVTALCLAFSGCDFGYSVPAFVDAASIDASPVTPDAPEMACPSQAVEITMRGMAFDPEQLMVPIGTRVTWVNDDTTDHDVTEGDPRNPAPLFQSGNLRPGEQWSMDFCSAGSYVYHCAAHPDLMRDATLVVLGGTP